MDIEEIKKYLKIHKISYERLSEDSKIPLSTLKKIFCGKVKSPRIDTFKKIEQALGIRHSVFTPQFTDEEIKLIQMYKELDQSNKKMVYGYTENAYKLCKNKSQIK